MYNRYIPSSGFQPVEPEPSLQRPQGEGGSLIDRLLSQFGLGGGKRGGSGLSGLLGIDKLDKGDILLVLVLIYLFKESEDDEWLIILALVLLMGL